jgi:hypothetical protein
MKTQCPPDEVLAEYLEGFLEDADQAKLEAHIADCGICLDTVTEGARLLNGSVVETDPVPSHVTQSAIDIVTQPKRNGAMSIAMKLKTSAKSLAARISDAVSPTPAGGLHPLPIRGSKQTIGSDRVLLKKTFEDIDTEIDMEKNALGATDIRIRVVRTSPHIESVRVSLQKSGREVFSQLMSGGAAFFEDVTYDRYSLVFTTNGTNLGAFSFEIKETMND